MALDRHNRKLLEDVAKYGWHVVMVSSRVDEPEEPPFAYTVGLQATFGWPELLCYGLELNVLATLLNNAVAELRDGAMTPMPGTVLHEVAEGFDCRLSPVEKHHHHEHLGYAIWHARYRCADPADIQCLQLLWPDRAGNFPDEAGCAEEVKELQPLFAS